LKLSDFSEKLNEFLNFLHVEKNLSSNTIRAYKRDLLQLFDFWKKVTSKDDDMQSMFNQSIQRYMVSLFHRKITKSSLARKLSSIRSFVRFLHCEYGIVISLNEFKSPKIDRKIPVVLTVDEISYLLDSVKHDDLPTKYPYRDKAIFELLYATGMRCSELVGIKLLDIDNDERSIKIKGKGNKERIVFYGSKAQKAIESYNQEERYFMIKEREIDFLFLNCRGTKLTQRSVQRVFNMFRKFLNVDRKLTPHNVRHSFATHMLRKGVSLRHIQEFLGHKSISSTQIYTHVSNAQLSKLCDEKHPLNELGDVVLDDS
jgi:site-specific recombinase XerD